MRMRRWTKITIAMLLSLLVSLPAGSAWAGGSRTHVVREGESIQAAIDAARPGDTILVKPGEYAESLKITTDDLTLKGSRGTVLTPPDDAEPCFVFGPGAPPTVEGICVAGDVQFGPTPEDPPVINDVVEGTRISGFEIRGFSGNGIFALATEDLRASRNRTDDNAEYGIFVLLSTGPVLAHNKASGNGVAGLYVGGNQEVDAKIYRNTSWDNPIGIFLRDVSFGTAERNHVFGNCTGILMLAGAPGPLTNWKIRRNLVKANNRTDCGEEDPVPSGVGILLLGAADNDISRNVVLRNRSADPSGGGIVLVTGGEPGGPQLAPSGNAVRKNVAFGNEPFDIFWDETGDDVTFRNNRCGTSQPAEVCD
jgi:parallel beta-helix repeat protein